jgi:hypothetical protein
VLESGLPADLLLALARLNTQWAGSPGDPALAEASLRGLLWLALQTYDKLDLANPILGKALALFAIAEAREPGHLAREECLLACLLGYEDHAKHLAQGLPADDPVRLFADWDLPGLKALARSPKAEPRTEYLYLLRLAENRTKEDAWFSEFEASSWSRRLDGPSLRLVLTLDPFGWRTTPATLMESQVLEDLSPAPRVAGSSASSHGRPAWRETAMQRIESLRESGQKPPESRLSAFEEAVNSEASRLDGALLDRQVVRAFRFSNFYSSVYAAARYYFDALSSTEGAEELGNSLTNPPAGTAAELKDWILHRVQLQRSAEAVGDVAADLFRLRHIGTDPLSRISYSVAISSDGLDPIRRAHVHGFFDRLDSRPSNLHSAAATASELLDDIAIMEQCLRLGTERGPRELGTDLPWALGFLGDEVGLRALARDKTWPSTVRVLAVQEQARLEKTEPRILLDQFRELIREDPTEGEPVRAAVGILEKQEQIESALLLINEWIKVHAEQDLTWAGVTSLKSRLLRKQGRFREAWDVAQPAAMTWKAECLEEAALALVDLARMDEALDMAKKALDRYGGDSEAALVARILWMKARDDEAGQLLSSPKRPLAAGAWSSELPSAFNEAFKKDNDARAEEAFVKLAVPSIPTMNVVWFVEYLTNNGRAGLAVKLCEYLRGREPAAWVTVAKYHAMGKAQSAAAARDWLRANATPGDLDVFAKQALQDGDYELVWDLPDHPDPTKNEILYMIRAACLLYQPQASEERRTRVIAYFQSRPKKDFVAYGLFLLGQIDRTTLFAQIKDPSYLCSVGWILGLTSAHEGRYEEANAWLQVSMEAGANIPPRNWASGILGRWRKEGGVLAEVAQKRIY